MTVFELMTQGEHEQIVFCADKASGLKAIIGIHSTTLGPALGGCRMKAYASEDEALKDVLKLSQAMTYKSSAAGLNLGGGKTVVMLDNPEQKTPELLQALAKRIDALHGTYIGAGDIGSDTRDLKLMRQTTPWVTGLAKEDGGLGDSAILTSLGVFMGLKAAVKERLKTDDLNDIRVLVQGSGKVGYGLIERLIAAGAKVWVSDVNTAALDRVRKNLPQVTIVSPENLLTLEAEVFSPNAVGGALTPELAQSMNIQVVAGGANNILSEPGVAMILKARDILYAPDFLINAGGVIMVASEIEHHSFEVAQERTEAIFNRSLEVFRVARESDMTTVEAALHIAQQRIAAVRAEQAKK